MGMVQLDYAASVIGRYRDNGGYFDRALANIPGITLLLRPGGSIPSYWTYSLRAERRAGLMRKLHANGIGAQRLHLRNDCYSCFTDSRSADALPGVDLFDRENLSIPCGWWVTAEDRERIAACIRSGW
jgi:dTDP-4-amino-4,6-dideoxygalactose transaminase